MRRSTEASLPVFSNVVIAYVAILRFESEMRFSMSRLHVATLLGWVRERALKTRMAANLSVGLGDERKSWRTIKVSMS